MKEFINRPTLRLYKQHQHHLRWERRMARAPHYGLKLLALLTVATGLLVGSILGSIWLGR